jgi:hypothetical protein
MKKYILKPGKHQFAPGSHAVHENDSISDEEAEWYLKKYPHIASLFEQLPVPEKEPITELEEMEFPFVRKSKANSQ